MPLCIDVLYHSITIAPFAFDQRRVCWLREQSPRLERMRRCHEVGGAGRSHDLWLVVHFWLLPCLQPLYRLPVRHCVCIQHTLLEMPCYMTLVLT